MNQRLIRLPQVKSMVGLGRSSIYDKIKRGEFPKQIKLGRSSGWVEAEVQLWISEQIQASRLEPVTCRPNNRAMC
ncbi:MAG: AlpA family transcriptional regulator [Planctomycetales bacterium]|jgi:prophage regulatory protein|uniref:helix-turn-helix transcriptional regulator n=1 Tax=Candidatus Accumulibacter meliphilus TaxID=2211374 RepID=UPI001DA8187D|nr:AlpA family transcriptional regulator [Planctomycetales bacterium]